MKSKELRRSRTERQIAGVCGGFAEYVGADVGFVRFSMILLTLISGIGIFVYFAAALCIPLESLYEGDENPIHVTPD